MSASIWQPGSPASTILAPTGPIAFVPGTVGAPGITFQSDLTTGFFQTAVDNITVTINGVQVGNFDPTGNFTTSKQFVFAPEKDVASAATVDLGAQNANMIHITGSSDINSFGTNYKGPIMLRFGGVLNLVNSSTLILPSGANIATAPGDTCIVNPKATSGTSDGWAVISYTRASGGGITANTDLSNSVRVDVASASVVDLVTLFAAVRNINITGTTTINSFTIASGSLFFVRFNAALTLTNSVNLVTQRGANIVTAAGDTCIIRATLANVVEILCYTPAAQGIAVPTLVNGKWLTNDGVNPLWANLTPPLITRQATRSANTILAAADLGTLIDYYTSSSGVADFTQTLTAAATLGNGWWCILRNIGLGLGANVVVNGTFSTSTDWTLGSGVAISAGTLNYTASSNSATANIAPLVAGRTYNYSITCTAFTSGSVALICGGVTQVTVNSATTFTGIFVAAGTALSLLGAAATLSIDNLSITDDSGATVTLDPNGAELIGGVSTAAMTTGDEWLLHCDGTGFQIERLAGNHSQVYTSGTSTFTVPAGVYNLHVEMWDGGNGAANTASGTGASAGAYCELDYITTPGSSLSAVVGTGGVGGGAGPGASSFGISTTALPRYGYTIQGGNGCGTSSFAIAGASAKGVAQGTNSAINGSQPGGGGATCNNSGNVNGGAGMIKVTWK